MPDPSIFALTGDGRPGGVSRRGFLGLAAAGAAGLALGPVMAGQDKAAAQKPAPQPPVEITTNVDEIRKIPRATGSLPGRFPGKVVRVSTGNASVEGRVDPVKVKAAVDKGMLELTGRKSVAQAWLELVSPKDIIGIKVNPISLKRLPTRPEVVDAILDGLAAAGVSKSNIVIWDRRLFQLLDAGYTPDRFPGISILGTEMRGPNNDFYDEKGELWAKDNIDRETMPYVADTEMAYARNTLPYMINQGKESYFTKIVTQKVTKIINVPVLKNSGGTATLCLKNLSYGSLSNTSRLHKIWAKSVAEPCAMPPIRDKVVLNIADGLRACYEGGPAADKPQYFWDANLLMFGTDPVAVDQVGHDIIVRQRISNGIQQAENPRNREFLDIAAGLGLGVADEARIALTELSLE